MKFLAALPFALLLATSASAQTSNTTDVVATDTKVKPITVVMKSQDGSEKGTVTITQTPNGVYLQGKLRGIEDGEHAFHFHETGKCEGDFSSAGSHFNPTASKHGFKVEGGMHAGDMPNIDVKGGEAAFDIFNPNVTLSEGVATLNDQDGAAIILHAKADDYESQPSGDAGGRLVCGVVYAAGK